MIHCLCQLRIAHQRDHHYRPILIRNQRQTHHCVRWKCLLHWRTLHQNQHYQFQIQHHFHQVRLFKEKNIEQIFGWQAYMQYSHPPNPKVGRAEQLAKIMAATRTINICKIQINNVLLLKILSQISK